MFSINFSDSKKNRGFTLIELLVVITILGVLATVLITAINPTTQRNRGRDAQRKSDVRQIQSALEFYRSDVGSYPDTIACGGTIANGSTTYMKSVPCPPGGGNYFYTVGGSPATAYCLRACLQVASDPDRDANNAKYGNTEAPTPAQMGSTCANFASSCAIGTVTYTVLNP